MGAELEHSGLATAFVGPTFTLSGSVYETVWGTPQWNTGSPVKHTRKKGNDDPGR